MSWPLRLGLMACNALTAAVTSPSASPDWNGSVWQCANATGPLRMKAKWPEVAAMVITRAGGQGGVVPCGMDVFKGIFLAGGGTTLSRQNCAVVGSDGDGGGGYDAHSLQTQAMVLAEKRGDSDALDVKAPEKSRHAN